MHFRSGNWTKTIDSHDETDKLDNFVDDQEYGYSIREFDPTLDKIIKNRLNVDDVIKRHRRVRRSVTKKDTIEHVTKIMESIEEELDDLKVNKFGEDNISFSNVILYVYYRLNNISINFLIANSRSSSVWKIGIAKMLGLTGRRCKLFRSYISRS